MKISDMNTSWNRRFPKNESATPCIKITTAKNAPGLVAERRRTPENPRPQSNVNTIAPLTPKSVNRDWRRELTLKVPETRSQSCDPPIEFRNASLANEGIKDPAVSIGK
jgi:hypothetical protein